MELEPAATGCARFAEQQTAQRAVKTNGFVHVLLCSCKLHCMHLGMARLDSLSL